MAANHLTTRGVAAAFAALTTTMSPACRDIDVVTASYANVAEARAAGAIEKGRLPQGVPAGATGLREAFDTDTNARWGLFDFPAEEGGTLQAWLERAELPLAGVTCDAPRRLEWWPVLLRGALDPARIAATGLQAYRSHDRSLIVLVNWRQGRAYYWSPPR